jgi:hypothetical protein
MDSLKLANDLIERAKQLQQFEVKRMLSHSLRFTGNIPFDMRANQDCAWFKVYAVSKEEADTIVDNWLDSHYEY